MRGYNRSRSLKERRKKLIIQKLMGLGFLVMSVLLLLIALHGKTVEDRDCTVLLFTFPMALYLIFTGSVIIN